MPNLSIKDVPEALAEALRQRAARNHRSLQGELMALLEEAVGPLSQMSRVAEPDANYAASSPTGVFDIFATLLEQCEQRDTPQRADPTTSPVTRDEYVRRLDAVVARVNPDYRAADRLTREQANDRAFLHSLGI